MKVNLIVIIEGKIIVNKIAKESRQRNKVYCVFIF